MARNPSKSTEDFIREWGEAALLLGIAMALGETKTDTTLGDNIIKTYRETKKMAFDADALKAAVQKHRPLVKNPFAGPKGAAEEYEKHHGRRKSMGIYTEKFREITDKLPKTPDQFASPMHAASAMAHLTNAVLQCLASLEEALEDAQRENEKLQELLIEGSSATKVPSWNPNSR